MFRAGSLPARVASVALAAAIALGFWIQTLPQPSLHPAGPAVGAASPVARPGYSDAEVNFPLAGELGIPLPGVSLKRTLLTSSGRLQAWGGAVRQVAHRPVAGYGFGTEGRVFVDRWSTFVGSLPENAYVGLALQLGIVGLVLAALLVLVLVAAARRRLLSSRPGIATACLGALVAGLVLAVVQSYLFSVGNIAATSVWICAFLLAAAGASDA